MITARSTLSESDPVLSKLAQVRSRKTRIGALAITMGAIAVLLTTMLIAMLIDWLVIPRGTILRTVLTTTALSYTAAIVVYWIIRLVRTERSWVRVATDVDQRIPGMEERWLTLTELRQDSVVNEQRLHPAMLRTFCNEVVARDSDVAVSEVVDTSNFRQALAASGALMVFLCAGLWLAWPQTSVLLQRFWLPQAKISLTQIHLTTPSHVVAKGEPFSVTASISGRQVPRADIRIRNSDNDSPMLRRLFPEDENNTQWKYTITKVDRSLKYQIQAGDGTTEWQEVVAADRPELAQVNFRAQPPGYSKLDAIDRKELPTTERLLEGTTFVASFLPRAPVQQLTLQINDTTSVTLQADEQGWYHWEHLVEKDVTFSPKLVESHGLQNEFSPVCKIEMYRDEAPRVDIITPDDNMAVSPRDGVDIEFDAVDDIGVERAEVVVYGAALTPDSEPPVIDVINIPLDDQSDRRNIHASAHIDLAKYELKSGSQIYYAVRVVDTRQFQQDGSEIANSPLESKSSQSNANGSKQEGGGHDKTDVPNSTQQVTSSDAAKPPMQSPQDAIAKANIQPSTDKPSPAKSNNDSSAAKSSQPSASVASNAPRPAATTPSADKDNKPVADGLAGLPPNPNEESPDPTQQAARTNDTESPTHDAESLDPTQPAARPNDTETPAQVGGAPAGKNADTAMANATKEKNTPPETGEVDPTRDTATSDQRNLELVDSTQQEQAKVDSDPLADAASQANTAQADTAQTASQPNAFQTNTAQANTAQANTPQSPAGENEVAVPDKIAAQSTQPKMNEETDPTAQQGTRPPGNAMTKRMSDLPSQMTTSKQKSLTIDEWAGNFAGQQQEKVALAIAPVIAEIDALLKQAEQQAQTLTERAQPSGTWNKSEDILVGSCDKLLTACEGSISELTKKSTDSPYAFVGLQFSDIAHSHITPARDSLWNALQDPATRLPFMREALQHISAARLAVREFSQQFERIRRDHQLANNMERVKKMYQVFLENAMLELRPNRPDGINNYARPMAELNVDDEYLARLQEVLEMRRDMMSELARILADDPRLLQRYVNRFLKGNDSLRDQVTLLSLEQQQLQEEVLAWSQATETSKKELLASRTIRHHQAFISTVEKIAELQERFVAWAPLQLDIKQGAIKETHQAIMQLAATAAELQSLIATTTPQDDAEASSPTATTKGEQLIEELRLLDASLRKLGKEQQIAGIENFATLRLADIRRILEMASAWVRQEGELEKGSLLHVAAIDQYRLAQATETLFQKFANGQTQFLSLIEQEDQPPPADIAAKYSEILADFEQQLAPSQLSATYALQRDRQEAASSSEKQAAETFLAIDKKFDALFERMIEEMNKLPVLDPIAALLEDPTLDEILRILENESTNLAEILGIPGRPTNLQVVGDWLQPGSGGGGGNQGPQFQQMLRELLKQERDELRKKADEARKVAERRAEQEVDGIKKKPLIGPLAGVRKNIDKWNIVQAKLQDQLLQGQGALPPERYRRAIEDYFDAVSRLERDDRKQP